MIWAHCRHEEALLVPQHCGANKDETVLPVVHKISLVLPEILPRIPASSSPTSHEIGRVCLVQGTSGAGKHCGIGLCHETAAKRGMGMRGDNSISQDSCLRDSCLRGRRETIGWQGKRAGVPSGLLKMSSLVCSILLLWVYPAAGEVQGLEVQGLEVQGKAMSLMAREGARGVDKHSLALKSVSSRRLMMQTSANETAVTSPSQAGGNTPVASPATSSSSPTIPVGEGGGRRAEGPEVEDSSWRYKLAAGQAEGAKYSTLRRVADGSYRDRGEQGKRVAGRFANTTGEMLKFALARGFDDVWTATEGSNVTHAPVYRGKLTPKKAIERIKRVLGNGTMPQPATDPMDFTLPTPELDGITLTALSVACVTMIGSFLSALVGFAFALTTTSLLSNLIGSKTAQPLVAVLFFVNQCILLHKKGLGDWRETGVLIAASFVTVPVGIFALVWLDAALGEQCLGFLIVCYVLYSLADFKLPELKSQWHTIGTGLFAGLTVGAFNIGGPWIAMYGQCRRWRADKFASNLITYQAPTCVLALAVHVFRGSFQNKQLWYYAACAIPGMMIGSQIGEVVSKKINEATFKMLTMMLIAVMGARLLLNGQSAQQATTLVFFFAAAAATLVYTKRSQGPKDKNLVLPMGAASDYSAAVAGNATPKQLSPRPLGREMHLREDAVYTGGDAELEEGGRLEGGLGAGIHHRGHAADA